MTRLPRLLPLLPAIAAVAGAPGCAVDPGSGAPATFPEEALATMTSEHGDFAIEVRSAPEQPPSRGIDAIEYRISVASSATHAPAEHLSVSVVPWMPDMGHGASVTPAVTDEGDGHYVVSDVELFMPGKWELRTTITGASEDAATPTFEIP